MLIRCHLFRFQGFRICPVAGLFRRYQGKEGASKTVTTGFGTDFVPGRHGATALPPWHDVGPCQRLGSAKARLRTVTSDNIRGFGHSPRPAGALRVVAVDTKEDTGPIRTKHWLRREAEVKLSKVHKRAIVILATIPAFACMANYYANWAGSGNTVQPRLRPASR
jgi:hypothetical protein